MSGKTLEINVRLSDSSPGFITGACLFLLMSKARQPSKATRQSKATRRASRARATLHAKGCDPKRRRTGRRNVTHTHRNTTTEHWAEHSYGQGEAVVPPSGSTLRCRPSGDASRERYRRSGPRLDCESKPAYGLVSSPLWSDPAASWRAPWRALRSDALSTSWNRAAASRGRQTCLSGR